MQTLYALTGTLFFLVFTISIIVFGDVAARNVAIFSAFLGGLSQFIAQDDRPGVGIASVVMAYMAMLTSLVAFAMMASH